MSYTLLRLASGFFQVLPLRLALALGRALGWIWYFLIPIRRSVALDNLSVAMPDLPAARRRRIIRDCFKQLGMGFVEMLRLPKLTQALARELLEDQGWEHVERALAQGRGLIVVCGHFGNFDLMACAAALRGLPLHVITRESSAAGVNRFWMKTRSACGLRLLGTRTSPIRLGRILKRGGVLALLVDQHMPVGRGIPVPFFGRPASTTHAPAVLALTTGAPLLPVGIERLEGGRHRLRVEPALSVRPDAPRQEEIRRLTRTINQWLEDKVRARPDHWLWVHRRWK